ncbi:MAG TPA: GFA family protein [Turneriella sp.]|nr:GFA family protein [Turneriella sp.]
MSVKKYTGSCHCGEVRYEVQLDLTQPVTACNCSMCGRSGTYLTFVSENDFVLKSGSDSLQDYQFNKKHIHHLFCKVCGIKPFARGAAPDGSSTIAVNVRCLDGIEFDKLQVQHYNGKSL